MNAILLHWQWWALKTISEHSLYILSIIDESPFFFSVYFLFSLMFLFLWDYGRVASSLSQHEDTLRVGNEGLFAWGQAFPDGSVVQLDQA